jgi:hypothetical protein
MEAVMNRGMLLSLVNVLLVAGLVVASTDVVAQQSSGSQLVTTQCGFGQLNICGTETIGQQCTYVFGLSGEKGAFGFNFGGWKCAGGITQNRYKDYDRGTASGTCVVLQRPPADATSTRHDEDAQFIQTGNVSGSGESC